MILHGLWHGPLVRDRLISCLYRSDAVKLYLIRVELWMSREQWKVNTARLHGCICDILGAGAMCTRAVFANKRTTKGTSLLPYPPHAAIFFAGFTRELDGKSSTSIYWRTRKGRHASFCCGDHSTTYKREITRCDEARKTLLNYSLMKHFCKRFITLSGNSKSKH